MSEARWVDPREYDARDLDNEWPRVYDSAARILECAEMVREESRSRSRSRAPCEASIRGPCDRKYTKQEVIARATSAGLRSRKGLALSPQSFGQMMRNSIYVGKVESPELRRLSARRLRAARARGDVLPCAGRARRPSRCLWPATAESSRLSVARLRSLRGMWPSADRQLVEGSQWPLPVPPSDGRGSTLSTSGCQTTNIPSCCCPDIDMMTTSRATPATHYRLLRRRHFDLPWRVDALQHGHDLLYGRGSSAMRRLDHIID
jgi:hypothetical protein